MLEFTDWVMVWFNVQEPVDTLIFVVGCLAMPFVVWVAWNVGDRPHASEVDAPPRSVAVLPFATVGTDLDTEFLGLGLADQILSDLTHI